MGMTQSTCAASAEKKNLAQPIKIVNSSTSGLEPSEEVTLNNYVLVAEGDLREQQESSDDDGYESDSEHENEDRDWQERQAILKDARELKRLAEFFLQPETPIAVDSTATARCYFGRPSCPTYSTEDDATEQDIIFEELAQLKKLAVDYLHPELPVQTTDPCACGRNYFTRPSAPTNEDEEERSLIFAEMQQMKQISVEYLHPELPVRNTDPFACGRNYFTRPSAPSYDDGENAEERSLILAEMQQMKQVAVDYLHPELPVQSADPTACGRNYFSRPSAPSYDDFEGAAERNLILAEMQQMKQLAIDYLHPELPVKTTDPCACSRNYFTRPSAPSYEDGDDAEERSRIMAEMQEMKQLAIDYLNPEIPVETTDPSACGRNYFTRPSAPGLVDQTHTYCEYVDHDGFHHVIDHDHHYYWYHKAEREGKTAHDNEDGHHFEMDDDYVNMEEEEEEPFYEFEETTLEVDPFKGVHAIDFAMKDEVSMSRSPQSVLMLTWEGALSA